ncbi:MAG TPA: DNA gyrase C-terminal beta-propeller domain-containing protein, partial [Candidatus Saccharimonadales bacterium]|nr:DNA gyrase C-terminal beta-propeller domain-containing protein [Candidatus Saccharimonadales bacterium]
LLELGTEEKILSILPVKKQAPKSEQQYKFVTMATKSGTIKKTAILSYEAIRRSGIIAIKLTQGDQLRWAKLTTGTDLIFMVSKKGMSIKFQEGDVRPMARDTMGVRGIKLKAGDELIGMDVIDSQDDKADLLVVTEKGIGKKTQISAWPKQLRGGVGVKAASLAEKTGDIVTAQILTKEDDGIILTSQKGQVMRTTLRSIPRLTRDTQGVIVMRLSGGDKVAATTILQKKKEEEEAEAVVEAVLETEAEIAKTQPKEKGKAAIDQTKPKAQAKTTETKVVKKSKKS